MQKLELWEQNEPLFADKLNNEVKTVNAIIDKLNTQPPNSSGGGMGSITYPQFYSTQRELLQMWDADGEGVILSGHDFGFVGESGLYARNNEAVLNGQRFVPKDRELKKIADYSELQIGGVLYQEITLANGTITNSQLKYTNDDLPNDTETMIYRKLSRIEADCKSYSCGDKQGRFKAIAVNETKLQTANAPVQQVAITTAACTKCQKCHDDYRYKRQTYKLFEDCRTKKDFYGLSNEGGLEFVFAGGQTFGTDDFDKYHGIRGGIEIYKVKECGGSTQTEQKLNEDDPRPQYDKLASSIFDFPVKVNEYTNDGENWVLNCVKCKGTISLQSVQVAKNNWQIGFKQSGEISIDTYKPTLTGGTTGEIICYDVKAKESENNIVSVCKKQTGNKITFEIEGFYCFDPEFFCVTACGADTNKRKVTLNTAALYEMANEVANAIQVCVTSCGIVDTISNGKIKVATQGLTLANEEYTAATNVSVVSC